MDTDDNDGDIQVAKRELIKVGLERGYVTLGQIREYLPIEHMTDSELQVLRFTFETMGIDVRSDDDDDDDDD